MNRDARHNTTEGFKTLKGRKLPATSRRKTAKRKRAR